MHHALNAPMAMPFTFYGVGATNYACNGRYVLGTASALAYLTPKKEKEIFIIAPTANNDFFTLLHFTLRAYMDSMRIYAWSLAIFLPVLDSEAPSLPAIVRIDHSDVYFFLHVTF